MDHQGQKELEVVGVGTIQSVDFGSLALRMTEMIQKNVVDPELRKFIMPEFITTSDSHRVVAAILKMGAMQKYFSFKMLLKCGISSVTLLGERVDWQLMLKVDKLEQLGEEPMRFVAVLKAVFRGFIASFDDPTAPEVLDFCGKITHRKSGGSGSSYLSGWIAAFCCWDEEGRPLNKRSTTGCELDGIGFYIIELDRFPVGYASVPVLVDDNGKIYHTEMLVGSLGVVATSSGQMLDLFEQHEQRYWQEGAWERLPYVARPPTGA